MIKKNIFSIVVALIILYLSLASSDTFKNVPFSDIPNLDKLVHFAMYFGLMSAIIFDNRKTIKSNRQLLLIALIPLFYGILMEILQATLTVSRFGSIYDVMANSTGIITSIIFWLMIKRFIKSSVR
jgi:VanZ family protein